MHAAEVRRVAQRDARTKPSFERLLEQRAFIDLSEHFRHGILRHLARNAERLNLTHDARAAAVSYSNLGSRAGEGRTAIVDRTLAAQPRDGGIDILGFELAAAEPCAKLSFCELTAREECQAGDIRAIGVVRHQRVPDVASTADVIASGLRIW